MTVVKEDVLPELMSSLFWRIRRQLDGDDVLGELRMSHVRVMSGVPPEGISVTELAQLAGMTKQGCGQFVTRLSATGHLRSAADPADGRVRLVFRTARGDRFMARVYAALARVEDDFASQVGERRYATFKRVLTELVDQPV
jgi:DNA-binding MarR family transcriptional regulator